jgi:hypothetical protein
VKSHPARRGARSGVAAHVRRGNTSVVRPLPFGRVSARRIRHIWPPRFPRVQCASGLRVTQPSQPWTDLARYRPAPEPATVAGLDVMPREQASGLRPGSPIKDHPHDGSR